MVTRSDQCALSAHFILGAELHNIATTQHFSRQADAWVQREIMHAVAGHHLDRVKVLVQRVSCGAFAVA